MDKKGTNLYNKKMKLYKKLGAEQFQKVVFNIEKKKFSIIKKLFPNFLATYDKHCDKKQAKMIKKAKSEEEIKAIKRNFQISKMAMRKEFIYEKNRNYHIDRNKPTEIYKYLLWNKSVHKNGLIKDGILIAITSILIACGMMWTIPILIAEIISAGINFECVNIQNYNICKYKIVEEKLKKREAKKIDKNIDDYNEVSEIIDKSLEKSENIPSISEIIEQIDSIEKLNKLREMLLLEQNAREQEKKRGNNL